MAPLKTITNHDVIHTRTDRINFSLYAPEEIKKLSVVKIITPLSFNALGHALPGGLYDLAMGPHNVGALCDTCQQTITHCPGHFGHIELPLPVINPLFTKTILQLFRISCLSCHAITIPGIFKYLFITQLKLLRYGFLKEAQDAELVLGELGIFEQEGKKGQNLRVDDATAQKKFEDYMSQVLESKNIGSKTPSSSKNIENISRAVLKRVFSHASMSQKCPFCGVVCRKMMLFESRIVYSLSTDNPQPARISRNAEFDELDIELQAQTKEGSKLHQKYLTPKEAKEHLRLVYIQEPEFLKAVFPVLNSTSTEFPTDLLFVDIVPVPPPKNRPAQMVNNMNVEHPQNLALRHIVTSCALITYLTAAMKNGAESLSPEAQRAINEVTGASMNEKLETVWKDLQTDVEHVMDRERSKTSAAAAAQMLGIKQIIEKKEGLFRMHMMGKRVNYAARTVITPDPNLGTEEIGIPDIFARTLTFPTPVTTWNVQQLRKLVINGPNCHPGAVAVENDLGQICRLDPNNETQRIGVANRLLASDKLGNETFKGVKTVYRHLQNGDYLLLNRQPSLHRPSIMAHKAKVLYGDKVFRLHYANCKHYNADFDGDEMNAHFPQGHIARSEAANLVNVCSHYLTPKDGTPLAGLIQDHIVAAVKMTIRGRFFVKSDYEQLVFFALSNYCKKISTEPPTILKPYPLWSGKQVITTVVKNLVPEGKMPLSFMSSAKIKADEWRQVEARTWKTGGPISGDNLSESSVIFSQGELLSGVIDKVQLGATPYGLCHAFYELYGNQAVGELLSAVSRLMTNFLQWEGFTLGVKDVLVTEKADILRRKYMEDASKIGKKASAGGVSIPEDSDDQLIFEKLEQVHRSRDVKNRALVDLSYKQNLDQFTNKINKACLPHGLVSIFPHNNLQLLVQSGAKGSTVNTMQMSCLLGQIELEGKRPSLTASGRSLPSFKLYDVTPRAGGFISGRFLTGIMPQEFFFHCMAGREGLIDTAVKTSRSGYLQRCLAKLLEGVVTQYDGTVRDSDGSVIQFLYGEDGLDVCKSQYLKPKQLSFLDMNSESILNKSQLKKIRHVGDSHSVESHKAELHSWLSRNIVREDKQRETGFLKYCRDTSKVVQDIQGLNKDTGRLMRCETLVQRWYNLSTTERQRYNQLAKRCPDPVISVLKPDCNFSAVPESLEDVITDYLNRSESEKSFRSLVYYKYMRALSAPGDAVGVLAAQSIGEPSTQMTLNTFHFAGRGEMNVTLGIPRLREILMVASANIRTPAMEIPFCSQVSDEEAEKLRLYLTQVCVSEVLQYVEVTETVDRTARSRYYALKFCFLSHKEYKHKFCVHPSVILSYFEKSFLRHRLLPGLRKAGKMKKDTGIQSGKESGMETGGNDEDDGIDLFTEAQKKGMGEFHESSDEEPDPEDADATQQTRSARQKEAEYDEPEEGEAVDDEGDEETMATSEVVDPEDSPEDENVGDTFLKRNKVSNSSYEHRKATVLALDHVIVDYDFDKRLEEWCKVTVKLPLSNEKINVSSIIRTVASKSVIHQVPNITRAFVAKENSKLILKTEGINILAMAKHRDLLELNKIHCNNVHTMAEHYGIEAGARVIVKEMRNVFKAYGIVIDPRHLNLIGDYMTFSGVYRPFNRIGIESSASPLQQMSFETVVSFLREATLSGKMDDLQSPSSRLILGKPTGVGTGLFQMRQAL